MTSFDGRLVFVTGGSMGIGLATAERLAARGADIVLFARRAEPLAAASERISARRRRGEQRVLWRELDVGDRPRVDAVLGALMDEFGPPDVLVNCAGRARPAYFDAITPAQLDETLRVNFLGCWHTVQAVLPRMRARGRGGYVVNTASLAGVIGIVGYTDYSASKFAVVGFSEALRNELAADDIAVSVLCPPDVDTPGFAEENRHKPPETIVVSSGGSLLTAGAVADALLAGMARRRFLIVPGRQARLTVRLKRWVPRLVAWAIDRQVRAARGTTTSRA
jgi:NAD(P)-dependent dehydrogenase (short-subunit alcohol dehydrogenase family)